MSVKCQCHTIKQGIKMLYIWTTIQDKDNLAKKKKFQDKDKLIKIT